MTMWVLCMRSMTYSKHWQLWLTCACLNPATRPAMSIGSSTDVGSELLLRSFPRAKSKVWQHFGFRKDNREIVDTKKVICRLGKRVLSYSIGIQQIPRV